MDQIEPIIYSQSILDLQANSCEIKALVTQKSTIYYTYAYQASELPTKDEIIKKNYKYGLGYGKIDTITLNDRVNNTNFNIKFSYLLYYINRILTMLLPLNCCI